MYQSDLFCLVDRVFNKLAALPTPQIALTNRPPSLVMGRGQTLHLGAEYIYPKPKLQFQKFRIRSIVALNMN
jgi:hypothetical protein